MAGLARIHHITFDCLEPSALAGFWSALLGFTEDPLDPNLPEQDEALILDPSGHHPGLLFVRVPEDKAVKNRLHLDLQPVGLRDDTVERVVDLGGRLVADHRKPDGTGWVVVADPEGNELCIERSAAERADATAPVDTEERAMPPK
jgi:catechol 2,3-dioxygenase-like lactoylglutathione lyase family enzyme